MVVAKDGCLLEAGNLDRITPSAILAARIDANKQLCNL